MLKVKTIFVCLILLLSSTYIFPQDIDIVPYLKKIESGNKIEVKDELPMLKKKFPNSSSVLFLDGILTENSEQAVAVFSKLLKNYPQSKYADAALYRIYTYYYAVGNFISAKLCQGKLKREYPQSPYIQIAARNIPLKNNELAKDSLQTIRSSNNKSNAPQEEVSSNYKYTIQAGAFSVLGNAELLKKQLENAGYTSSIEEKSVAGTIFHVVYTGKFQNMEDAKNFLHLINSKYNLDGRLVSLDMIKSN
ncbi:MAG: SPOR domain-containing protein [Bacteroidetes bacterium]|nr:SPOR domain-containing protein [Bacteroidota bacterium]